MKMGTMTLKTSSEYLTRILDNMSLAGFYTIRETTKAEKVRNIQGDPNQNLLFQMAVPLKLSIEQFSIVILEGFF